eukprot:572999-Prorocentrum_minimum.AAC.1
MGTTPAGRRAPRRPCCSRLPPLAPPRQLASARGRSPPARREGSAPPCPANRNGRPLFQLARRVPHAAISAASGRQVACLTCMTEMATKPAPSPSYLRIRTVRPTDRTCQTPPPARGASPSSASAP